MGSDVSNHKKATPIKYVLMVIWHQCSTYEGIFQFFAFYGPLSLKQACQTHFGIRAKFFENRIQNFFTGHTNILFLGSNFNVHFDFTKDLLSM